MTKLRAGDQRQLGKFYTPDEATKILCKWAIRRPDDIILEPSFGACGFLAASLQRLRDLACPKPNEQLYGCDVDPSAFSNYLEPLFAYEHNLKKRFRLADYLTLSNNTFGTRFNAIIGNPPYVSLHRLSAQQKKNIKNSASLQSWKLSGRADLWAYFVLHSIPFLHTNARMAWILPGSFLQSEYSKGVHTALEQQFKRVVAIKLGQKLFLDEGAKENSVVVLADGSGFGPAILEFAYVESLKELTAFIAQWEDGTKHGSGFQGNGNQSLLSSTAKEAMANVEKNTNVITLGNCCKIRIGIVTGANDFFILSQSQAKNYGLLPEHVRPIIPRFALLDGLTLKANDLALAVSNDKRCLLLDTNGIDEAGTGPIQLYLASFSPEAREQISTFQKRAVWHQPDDGLIPHGFFSYMHGTGPRLVLNDARTTCTNTVHRVFFAQDVSVPQQRAYTLSLLSTYSQLSAELEGKSYGSGVLKHEPSTALRISLACPQKCSAETTRKLLSKVDSLWRQRAYSEAQELIDQWVFADYTDKYGEKRSIKLQSCLRTALAELRQKRHPKKPLTSKANLVTKNL